MLLFLQKAAGRWGGGGGWGVVFVGVVCYVVEVHAGGAGVVAVTARLPKHPRMQNSLEKGSPTNSQIRILADHVISDALASVHLSLRRTAKERVASR